MLHFVAIVMMAFMVDVSLSANIAPSDNEAYVNKANAERQLYVNRIAASVGAGTGTAHLDGVPGTPLAKSRPYHSRVSYRSHVSYNAPHARSLSTGYAASNTHNYHATAGYGAHALHAPAPHGHATKSHTGYANHKLSVPHSPHSVHVSAYPVSANTHHATRGKAISVAYPSSRATYSVQSASYPAHGTGVYGGYGRGTGYGAHTPAYGNAIRAYVARGTGAHGTSAYGTGAYGTGAYGTGAYGTGAYGTGAYSTAGYGGYSSLGGFPNTFASPFVYGLNYGSGYGFGHQGNAQRQHHGNFLTLQKGNAVGSVPLYGVSGNYGGVPGHRQANVKYAKVNRKAARAAKTGPATH